MARVLVADDEERIRDLLRGGLALDGHDVFEASTGQEALELIRDLSPDVVLLDLSMPGMRGEQVLIRAREVEPPPDVIIITGHGTLDSATLAVRYHARDFLPKPFDLLEVRAKVKQVACEREALREEARRHEEVSQELVRSRTFLQSVLGACADALIVTDTDEAIILCNGAAAALCGCRTDELVGEPFSRLLDQTEDAGRLSVLAHHSDRIEGHEIRVSNRTTGRQMWVRASIAALHGESGERIGLVASLHDITQGRLLLQELREVNRRLEELSVTDPVTGAHNHRFFQERVRRDVQAARRYGHPLSVVLFDLDDFKALNDRYGHQCGDRALRTVAQVLCLLMRETDVLCRYGGEEFTAILAHVDKVGALEAAERLRSALEEIEFVVAGGEQRRLTASFGVASVPDDAVEPDALIAAADAAMYRAKRKGKNRVEG